MLSTKRVLLVITIILTLSICSYAAVPQTINYQGQLTNASGTPVNNAIQMKFSIYSVETSGEAIWSEIQTVQVTKGIYSVVLGAINQISPSIIDGNLWLGVKVETDAEMTPRQKLNSVPFALNSNNANSLSASSFYTRSGTGAGSVSCDPGDMLITGGASCYPEYGGMVGLVYSFPNFANRKWEAGCQGFSGGGVDSSALTVRIVCLKGN